MHFPSFRRPSAAMIVASTALVSSLAGPAVADEVAQIAQSITSSKQIKNGSVTGADVKNESISSTDILNGSVQTGDIGTGQVGTADLAGNSVRGDKIPPNTIDGSDVQDGALTGQDVNSRLLGKVKESDSADTAGSATLVGGKQLISLQGRANAGETKVLGETPDFVFRGICEDAGANGVRGAIQVESKTDNNYIEMDEEDADFDAGETAYAIEPYETTSENDYDYVQPGIYAAANDFVVHDEDGEDWSIYLNTTGADCRFNSSPFFAPAN